MKRRRTRRLYMLFPSWLRKKMTYKRNHALHAYEDLVLVAIITERGCADHVLKFPRRAATEWSWREPGRWDIDYLTMAFKRLAKNRTLKTLAEIETVRQAAVA